MLGKKGGRAFLAFTSLGCAGKVVNMEQEAGKSFSYEQIKTALETHKPAVLFLCQVRL